jgi:hypothetical protein
MMKYLKRKCLFAIAMFCCSLPVFAQQTYRFKARVPKVPADGFYQIVLQPELVAKCQPDLADLRILSAKGKFNPYIQGSAAVDRSAQNYLALPQVGTFAKTDTTTVVVVQNKGHLSISQLWLQLRNAAVQRTVNISGSDDLKSWYAIKEDVPLQESAGEARNGSYEQSLTFPPSTYSYFKIEINNKRKEQLAILSAGVYVDQKVSTKYVTLSGASFRQKDSAGVSYLIVNFKHPYLLNKLSLNIGGVKYYKRPVTIYAGKNHDQALSSVTLASSTAADLYFSAKTNKVTLEIYNGDNPPLTITSVTAYQQEQSVISYLETGEDYSFLFGDAKVQEPNYDLAFFTDSLKSFRQINHMEVIPNPLYKTKHKAESKIPSWLIWIAIAAVLSILTALAIKMTKELNKQKDTE